MMHKKGGGRESGGGLGTTKRALPQVEPVAAANPALCPIGWRKFHEPFYQELCHTHDKRIRELEETVKVYQDAYRELKARVAELKGELTRVRNLFQAGGWVTERVKVEKVLRPREREEC